MKIIDAHAHIYERLTGFGPRGEARAIGNARVVWATGEVEQFLKPEHGDKSFLAETLIQLMDEGGIDKAVILQGSNYGFQNDYIAEAVRAYPSRFVGAGSFDPYAYYADEIYQNLTQSLRFQNLKFELSQHYGLAGYHPELKIDGAIFDRYFSMAEESGITVTLDTGVFGTSGYQIAGILQIIKRHPSLKLVIAHSLFPASDERDAQRLETIKQLAGENVYFDIANVQSFKDPNRLVYFRSVMDLVGADHMMWGTDCPGVFIRHSYHELVDNICASGNFSQQEMSRLMYETAYQVYHFSSQ